MEMPYTPRPADDLSVWIGLRNAVPAALAFYALLYFGIHATFWLVQVIGRAL